MDTTDGIIAELPPPNILAFFTTSLSGINNEFTIDSETNVKIILSNISYEFLYQVSWKF